ncbi:MAG TPA: alpha/beta hydrolase [Bacteroidales bacterium]|nr:MAG: alpha/beta hydrolase [Bacteroidetes bacterium HGW-Bacteroidetes-22]HBZ67820.1 alpha/beta hydrolase [Bacteroidales bacterium]
MNEQYLNPLPGITVFSRWFGTPSDGQKTPVIVLLHEGLGCTAMWKNFPSQLHNATHLPVFSYDRPGYGLSGDLSDSFQEGYLEREADQYLPAILRSAGITGSIILLGHSDGATITLMAAANNELKIEGAISMAPHVIIEQISVIGLKATQKLASDTDFVERLSKYHGSRTSKLVDQWLSAWLSPWAVSWEMDNYLKQIHKPILFIQGTDDHFGTQAQAVHIAGLVKSSFKAHMIEQCGHIPHLQAAETVLHQVTDFITSLNLPK